MADSTKFTHTPKANSLGNHCATCHTHAHPDGFYEVNSETTKVMGYGKPAFCAGCVDELVRARGGLDPAQKYGLHGQLDEMSLVNEQLQADLAAERENKLVPLADVVDYFEERAKRRPDEPAPVTQPKTIVADTPADPAPSV